MAQNGRTHPDWGNVKGVRGAKETEQESFEQDKVQGELSLYTTNTRKGGEETHVVSQSTERRTEKREKEPIRWGKGPF